MITGARKGFTLLEILLVVAAIAILAGIVIFAINPGKQLAETRNAQRRIDVSTILNAIYQYNLDNGTFPANLPTATTADCLNDAVYEVCLIGVGSCTTVDLSVLTDNQVYLTDIPADPSGGGYDAGSGYHALKNENNRITVCAPRSENGISILKSL